MIRRAPAAAKTVSSIERLELALVLDQALG
jgi:hypothetical protein